jgi:glycosyltransferase involved in cell wall biosynthesis
LLDSPALARRVSLCGAQSPEETAAALARAELLVSASRMESYGMALAEARVVGVPILACAGGNARAHVAPEAGGQLVPDVPALARACLELARAPERLRERIEQARAHALPARSWHSAAQDFLDQFASLEK